MPTRTLSCRCLIGGYAEGEALVSREAVNFYLCDPKTGILLEKNHHLKGCSFSHKIVLMPTGKGSSVVQLDGLFQMKERGTLPKGLIVLNPEPVLVSSVYVVDIPMVDRLEEDPFSVIEDGDWIRIDADEQKVYVTDGSERVP